MDNQFKVLLSQPWHYRFLYIFRAAESKSEEFFYVRINWIVSVAGLLSKIVRKTLVPTVL
jgi:hypothetical protein